MEEYFNIEPFKTLREPPQKVHDNQIWPFKGKDNGNDPH